MKGYHGSIEQLTRKNSNFRQVLYTAKHSQLVLMSLRPGEEIGEEIHADGDQFFRFETGEGKVVIDETEYRVGGGDAVVVPAGARHNVINISDSKDLKLYTIYSPPHHQDGTLHPTKAEAESSPEHFDGKTTE